MEENTKTEYRFPTRQVLIAIRPGRKNKSSGHGLRFTD
jgi:hypothetical protein